MESEIDQLLVLLQYKEILKNHFRLPNIKDLYKIENEVNGKLPEDYKYFITKYKPGFFGTLHAHIEISKFRNFKTLDITKFNGFTNGDSQFKGYVDNLFDEYLKYKDKIPKQMLPFVRDAFNNFFLIDLSIENNGKIYFCNVVDDNKLNTTHKENLTEVASSFINFLKLLKLNIKAKPLLLSKAKLNYSFVASTLKTELDEVLNIITYEYLSDNSIQVIDNEIINYIETSNNGILPDDYKEFIKKYSGIKLSPNKKVVFKTELKGLVSPFITPTFFSYISKNTIGELLWQNIIWDRKYVFLKQELPDKTLGICCDLFRNLILISLETNSKGKIFYYNLVTKQANPIANSFTEFIKNIINW